MNEQKEGRETLTGAESAFIEFLARRGTTDSVEFDEFCASRPDIAQQLRELYTEWARLDQLIAAGAGTDSLHARLQRQFGADFDPGVDLNAASKGSEPASAVLQRLASESPKSPRYEPKGEIARGGMGVVLKVWDRDLRRNLAMKVVASLGETMRAGTRLRPKTRVLARFLEEAQITGQLEHPGIVPVHELGLDAEGRLFFTMPLVRGSELKDIIRLARAGEGGWNVNKALNVILRVCEAIAYAHSKGVVHRDLKPANVMVGRFGETYVMDWGLARVLGRHDTHDIRLRREPSDVTAQISTERDGEGSDSPLYTMDGDVVGTPAFMAPEQARGEVDRLGPRTDVYSIGAILYQLLTGQMPYVPAGSKLSPYVVLNLVLQGPPKRVLDVDPQAPSELVAICEKAMSRDAEQRYATALEVAKDIEAYLGFRPIAAREPSLSYALQLAYRRNRTASLAIAGACVGLLLWAGFYSVQMRESRAAEQRVKDFAQAHYLVDRADELVPTAPELVPHLQAWLESAGELRTRADRYVAERNRGDDVELQAAVARLDRLAALMPTMTKRLSDASTLRERSIDAKADLWQKAIADIKSSPIYGNLELAPQVGMAPLQKNPKSGLWEFWLTETGAQPKIADPATGALDLDAGSAVVMVLVPGGKLDFGPREDDDYRQDCDPDEQVDVAPYFVGKHEISQAQWQRAMGANPAHYVPGYVFRAEDDEASAGDALTPLNAVENVSFVECEQFAKRIGCELPTEQQWEHSAKAGSDRLLGWGDAIEDLRGRENVCDESLQSQTAMPKAPWNDAYPVTAPIGSFASNPWGLHDMLGNVSEWCATWYVDCRNPEMAPRRRVFRGGSWYLPTRYASPTFRHNDDPRGINPARGCRVVRAISS